MAGDIDARNGKRSEESLPILDAAVLDELRQYSSGAQDLAEELISLFLEDSPGQLTALRLALEAGDRGEIERRSHRLKGSSGSIGARRLQKVCEDLEKAARESTQPIPADAEAAVCAEIQVLEHSLRAIQRSTG